MMMTEHLDFDDIVDAIYTELFSYHKNRSETAPVPGIPLPAETGIHLLPAP